MGYTGGGVYGNLLNLAAYKLNFDFVQKMIQIGLPIDCTDFESNTSLHLAFGNFNKDPGAAKNISTLLVIFFSLRLIFIIYYIYKNS